MLEKLIEMLKKRREVVMYLIFGVLTTLVHYAVYLPCYYFRFFNRKLRRSRTGYTRRTIHFFRQWQYDSCR